jgi:hypothetical protein
VKVVCYHTGGRYKPLAEQLARSATAVGLSGYIYEMPDLADWKLNVQQKPQVMLRALADFPGEDILYVDADARFWKFPSELLTCQKDMAAFFHHYKPVSATLFLKNNESGREIAREWAAECEKRPDQHDDIVNLHAALQRLGKTRAQALPPSYYWNKEFRARFPMSEPVIEHFNVGEHTFPNPQTVKQEG